MIVAIHQPQYLPWLPLCDKADGCDVFVYLDSVQFQKNGVQNRNQIKTAQGPLWLTVPVHASLDASLGETVIADNHWMAKHVRTLRQSYARARHAGLIDELEVLINLPWESLAALNIAVTEWMFGLLGISARRVNASELGVDGQKEELVLAICRQLGASVYLSGPGARSYQHAADFRAANLTLQYHGYDHPAYPQGHPKLGFLPHLSALDLLLNCGPDSGAILRQGRRAPEVAA